MARGRRAEPRADGIGGGPGNGASKRLSALLACGVLSSAVYAAVDAIASCAWRESYDAFSQGFSELLAWGAPTRPFVLASSVLYNVLVIAFGLGVWRAGRGKWPLRAVSILLVAYAITGIVTPAFFPAPLRGVEAVLRNRVHVPLTGMEVLFLLASIGFGAASRGTGFRAYSIASLLVLVVFGVWAGSFVSRVAANRPTAWLGAIERVNIYGYLAWVSAFSISLLRSASMPEL